MSVYPMIRTLTLAAVCMLLHTVASAQDWQALATAARAAEGRQKVELLTTLAEQGLAAGRAADAQGWADEAATTARRLNAPALRARALHVEGLCWVQLQKSRRATAAFTQSNEVLQAAGLTDADLQRRNLEEIRALASQDGRIRVEQRAETELANLAAPPPPPPAPNSPEAELNALQEAIGKLQQAANPTARASQTASLRAELAAREAVISQMSEEQVKSELLLQEQRRHLDSLLYQGSLDSLAYANTELALQRARSEQQFTYIVLGLLLVLAAAATYSLIRARQHARVLAEKNTVIREEQARSEELLLNILPALVAEELKKDGHTQARFFDDVGVLFADFVGFTRIAEQLSPQQLVTDLDTCFRAFDEIIARYGLEKIKTIGDAYLCAGGLPAGDGSKLRGLIHAAREMQDWLYSWNVQRQKQGLPAYQARIGIHHGPVVAGVVGSRKFAFDIWGDTVNIAARIEAAGEGGRINVSGEVYEGIKDYFPCEYRGKIAAKNKGEIDMYFVKNAS